MVQKTQLHPAPGWNWSPPPFISKNEFLGVFHPFLQRSLYFVVSQDTIMSFEYVDYCQKSNYFGPNIDIIRIS